jgi:hypothetical protein
VGGDAEAVARRQRDIAAKIGMADGEIEHYLAPMRNGDGAAGLLRLPHLELKPARDIVQRRADPFFHGLLPDGARGEI